MLKESLRACIGVAHVTLLRPKSWPRSGEEIVDKDDSFSTHRFHPGTMLAVCSSSLFEGRPSSSSILPQITRVNLHPFPTIDRPYSFSRIHIPRAEYREAISNYHDRGNRRRNWENFTYFAFRPGSSFEFAVWISSIRIISLDFSGIKIGYNSSGILELEWYQGKREVGWIRVVNWWIKAAV